MGLACTARVRLRRDDQFFGTQINEISVGVRDEFFQTSSVWKISGGNEL